MGSDHRFFWPKKYCVSFIDDYNKFTWIYLLRHKSKVSKFILEFQQLVERMTGRKIITIQFNWGGEYEKLISFFDPLEFSIMCLALIHINKTVQPSRNITTLWRWGLHFSPMLLCLSNIGMRHSFPPPTSLVILPQSYSPMTHPYTSFLAPPQITLAFVCLGVVASLICAPTTPTNFSFAQLVVFF
jgi:hypothetical protein